MKLYFEEFKDEIDTLVEFLISDTCDFHGVSNPIPEKIRVDYKNKVYTRDDSKTF